MVRFGYGLGLERFERFRFSVPALPLHTKVFLLCFSGFQYRLTGNDVPVSVSVPGKQFRTRMKVIFWKFLEDCSYSFQRSFELISITDTVPLVF